MILKLFYISVSYKIMALSAILALVPSQNSEILRDSLFEGKLNNPNFGTLRGSDDKRISSRRKKKFPLKYMVERRRKFFPLFHIRSRGKYFI
jgi:hypothetical protein